MSLLEAKEIVKLYPGTVALDHVTASFDSGKIHALIGKNGSGKSTLLKIFAGVVEKTEGEVYLDGKRLELHAPSEAFAQGIVTVHQEMSLVPCLTVAENILIGRLPKKPNGLVDWKQTYARAKALLDNLGVDIPVKRYVSELNISQQQMVEIAKAMSFEPKVLQLDEPTSALANKEIEVLFKLLRRLRDKGLIIIYVSHRLHELWEICDTCTVLRDGCYIGTAPLPQTDRKEIIHMMFGDVVIPTRPADVQSKEGVVMEVKDLCREGKFEHISFQLHDGEVLGIGGMLGSGRTELLRSVFGADPFDSGRIYAFGEEVRNHSLMRMKALGFGMVQEDRGRDGLVLNATILQNLVMANYPAAKSGRLVSKRKEREMAAKQVEDLQIKIADLENRMTSLSGGNQQKVVVGKWLNTKPRIMFFDEPSRGIDVNAKQQIFKIIWDMSRQGISSIMVSSELEELIEVCTRILIMRNGRIVGEVSPDNVKVDQLYSLCMGGNEA